MEEKGREKKGNVYAACLWRNELTIRLSFGHVATGQDFISKCRFRRELIIFLRFV